jgi:hypothetical protein
MPALRAAPANLLTVGQSNAQVIGGGLNFFQGSTAATSDIPYLHYTPTYSGNRSTWTISFWAKPSTDSSGYMPFFMAEEDNFSWEYEGLFWFANNLYYIDFINNPSYNILWRTTAVYRDTAWYHIMAVKVNNSTFRLYVNGEEVTDLSSSTNNGAQSTWWNVSGQKMYLGGYINPSTGDGHSCESIMSQYYFIDGLALGPSYFGYTDPLTNTWRPKKYIKPSSYTDLNNGKDWTSTAVSGVSGWTQALAQGFNGSLSNAAEGNTYGETATITLGQDVTISAGGVGVYTWVTSGNPLVFELKLDGVVKETVNQGASGGQWYHSSSYAGDIDSITVARTGRAPEWGAIRINGQRLIDDYSDPEGWGINGFYLPFDGSAAIGTDQSGKGNNWTPVNFGGTDDVIPESPSGCSFSSNLGNSISGITTSQAPTGYCTWNPLQNASLKDGSLVTNGTGNFYSTIVIPKTGSWYWEVTANDSSYIGIDNRGQDGTKYIHYNKDGQKQITSGTTSAYGSSFTTNDLIGVAFNASNMTIRWYKNGVDQGEVNVGSGGVVDLRDLDLQCQFYTDSSNESSTNFGQKAFRYTPPEGYQSLNLANLPSPEFVRPDSVVGVTSYYGDSGNTNRISGYNFQPDLLWLKGMTGASGWRQQDSVRGDFYLESNDTAAQVSSSSDWDGFTSDGFIVKGTSGSYNSTLHYVGYCWKAGGSKNTFNVDDVGYASAAAAGLDGGSLDPSGASVNTKSKFGIYTWAGHGSSNETLAHGLGAKPDFMVCKKYSTGGNNWIIWHKSIGDTKYLMFTSAAEDTDATLFNSHTNDSDNLWSLGTNNSISDTGQSAVAYLWCDVPGLQKFGSYTGNGDADGTFVDLGFRPALLIIKRYDAGSSNNWQLTDAKRSPFNVADTILKPDQNAAEGTHADYATDFLSNGFKQRTGHAARNGSGNTYIYMAWAEQPMNNLYGGQSNAR